MIVSGWSRDNFGPTALTLALDFGCLGYEDCNSLIGGDAFSIGGAVLVGHSEPPFPQTEFPGWWTVKVGPTQPETYCQGGTYNEIRLSVVMF